MKIKYLFFAGIFLLFFASCTKVGSIHGVVKDQDGNFIENAKVELSPAAMNSVLTTSTGEFTFADLTPGLYKISVSKDGYETTQRDYTVSEGQTTQADFVLSEEKATAPTISIGNVTEVTSSTAKVTGSIDELGTETITDYGHCWSTSPDPTIANSKTSKGVATTIGEFYSNLTDLEINTTYYVKAYVTTSTGTYYTNELNFTTSAGTPAVTVSSPTNVDYQSVTANGSLNDLGAANPTSYGFIWSETNSNLTINSNDGLKNLGSPTITGNFMATITGLKAATTYYIRTFATNSFGTVYSEVITFSTKSSFTDTRDGHTYNVVQIGNQIWMKENLAYNAGDGCWAYDNNESYVATYGRLYTWDVALNSCPDGWHLPSNDEWTTLVDYLGGEDVAGGKLKETGTSHWSSPNTGATNESGFTALGAGCREPSTNFYGIKQEANWWSSTSTNSATAWRYYVRAAETYIHGGDEPNISWAFSVRCIKD